MVSFGSTAAAIRAAIAMQRAARGPLDGEHLSIRVGINVGEALEDESDYVGASVVIARRLCDAAAGGQILCSDLVAGLLRGRRGFEFARVGELELKGIPEPVSAFEVVYDVGPRRLGSRTPYVGRSEELSALLRLAESARAGDGAVALVSGEPGIGKTRIAEEVAEAFAASGGLVLRGASHEGDWSPPFEPFVQILGTYVESTPRAAIDTELTRHASLLSQLSAAVREAFPDAVAPPAVQPDEERYRLAVAMSELLEAVSERTPILVLLDDLHWCDSGTVAMIRRVARATRSRRILLLASYRSSDLTHDHPFAHAVQELPRDAEVQFVRLEGLREDAVRRLLSVVAEQDVRGELVQIVTRETGGNPFFIRELLLHLVEEGVLEQDAEGSWTASVDIENLRVPESVRHVLHKRLGRLSPGTAALLRSASVFNGEFRFDVAADAAELAEDAALDALDEAIEALILEPVDHGESYRFAHALLRQALYTDLNPSRRTRLHRRIAEALRRTFSPHFAIAHHAEIAEHFHESRELPGAETGVAHARAAGDHALATGAFVEAIHHYEIGLALSVPDDATGPRLRANLAIALAWSLRWDDAIDAALHAADGIEVTEGRDAAADFLALEAATISTAGSEAHSWRLVPRGLELVGDRRDLTWAVFMAEELFRRNALPESLGIELDVPERRELNDVLKRYERDFPAHLAELRTMAFLPLLCFDSRDEVLRFTEHSRHVGELPLVFAGELRSTLAVEKRVAVEQRALGHIASAAVSTVNIARAHTALGNLDDARVALQEAWDLVAIVPRGGYLFIQVANAQEEVVAVLDEGWEEFGAIVGVPIDSVDPVRQVLDVFGNTSERQFLATIYSVAARAFARVGRASAAIELLELALPAIRAAPPWAINLPKVICTAAETLWLTERTEYVEHVEDALREKVIAPDFRYPGVDGRLGMAWTTALQGRIDEASGWFARAREVLSEMGARPLLAVTDHDEALMHTRRGDTDKARPLMQVALHRFDEIGMPGWKRRALDVLDRLPA
jgi:tetratricopeptide (TPR) repeat protein